MNDPKDRTGKRPQAVGLIDRVRQFAQSHHFWLLSGILLLALALRLIALMDLSGSIYYDFMLWDERLYHEWAKKIADGTFYSSSVYEFAPVPAYFIALVYELFSPDIVYTRYANILLGVFSCYLAYLIGRELAGRTTGLLAALTAALYKPYILYNIVPLKTSLSIFLFAAAVYFFLVVFDGPALPKALFLGFFMGLLNYVRPNAIVLVPLFPVLILWHHRQMKKSWTSIAAVLILYIGGLALVHAPFMIRNFRVAGESGPTTSQTGIHLYMSTFPDMSKLNFVTTSPAERGVQFAIEASRRTGRRLTPRESSAYWTREYFKSVREKPLAYIGELFRKTLKFFNRIEKGDHYHIGFLSDYVKFFKLPFFSLWLVMPLGMAGLVVGMTRDRKYSALAAVFGMYASTLVLFFTNTRMRLPVLVILIAFAASGARFLCNRLRARDLRQAGIYLAVAAAFFIIEFLPGVARDDPTAHYNTYAIILDSQGRKKEALDHWQRSSTVKGRYSDFANLSLSREYMREGDYRRAFYYLDRIADDSFAAAHKYDILGDLLMRTKQLQKAVVAYERAIAINAGLVAPRRKLVKIFERVDPRRARIEYETLKYVSSFYDLYGFKR